MDISERIKIRRLELGLTLEDVANALKVAKSTVLRYETKDIHNMGIDKIEALSKILKCTPAFLMGWEKNNSESIMSDAFQLRLSELIIEKKIDIKHLVAELDIDRLGISNSDAVQLVKIADFFDVTIDYLLGRSNERKVKAPDIKLLAAHKTDGYEDPLTNEELAMVSTLINTYRKTKK